MSRGSRRSIQQSATADAQTAQLKAQDVEFWHKIESMESEMVIPPPSRPRTVLQGLASDRFDVNSMSTARGDATTVWHDAMEGVEGPIRELVRDEEAAQNHPVQHAIVDSSLFDPSIDMVGDSPQLHMAQPSQQLPLPSLDSLGDTHRGTQGQESPDRRVATPIMRGRTESQAPHERPDGRAVQASSRPRVPRAPAGSQSARSARSTRRRLGFKGRSHTHRASEASDSKADALSATASTARPSLDVSSGGQFGDAADSIAYDGEYVTSVTNFSQWCGQPSAPMVSKSARIPYEYLGKGRWRRLPINSARNSEGWGPLREELQQKPGVRSRLGMRVSGQ